MSSTVSEHKSLVVLMIIVLLLFPSSATATTKQINVLLVTGDWKSQKWYQTVVMGGKTDYRGFFIERKTNEAAPSKFAFTQLTNYAAQEYIDANYLSQFDVVLFGDVVGWSIPKRVTDALANFIQRGGGFVYCASYKWPTCLNQPLFDEILPTSLRPPGAENDDWKNWQCKQPETNFQPVASMSNHPITKGLDWRQCPRLETAYFVGPKNASDVVLKSPKGAPILVTGSRGAGRTAVSMIFANDEVSGQFCQDWKDIGKFYAQLFDWLAANSSNSTSNCQKQIGTVLVNVDATSQNGERIRPGCFGFNSAINPPNLGALSGKALSTFEDLNQEGSFSRISAQLFERQEGVFDYKQLDNEMQEFERLHLKPEIVFGDILLVPWIWKGGSWANPSDVQIRQCCDYVGAFLKHVNHGTGLESTYKPIVKFIEFGNEPDLDAKNMAGFAKLYSAVRNSVHANFPEVSVGTLGGYEQPYFKQFLHHVKGQVDFIARHPYGYTPEMIFEVQDSIQTYAKENGYSQIPFFITECDFWIAGVPKFDYMMKRTFASLKRADLIGLLHYRLDQYPEPVYLFGAIWSHFGPGAGKEGTPMHDAYDSYWIFRHFRGERINCEVKVAESNLQKHLYADACIDNDLVCAVVYYDQGYDGTGCKDFGKHIHFQQIVGEIKLKLTPSKRKRTIRIGKANGEGIEGIQTSGSVATGQTVVSMPISLLPHHAVYIEVSPD